nr:YlxR family protein [Quadrisphaera sp. INWT6]
MGCRQRGDRSRLLRVVAAVEGAPVVAVPDPGARLPGRGAWLHPDRACLDLAERRRAFARALRVQGPVDATAVREHLHHRAPAGQGTTGTHRPPPSTSNESGSSPSWAPDELPAMNTPQH